MISLYQQFIGFVSHAISPITAPSYAYDGSNPSRPEFLVIRRHRDFSTIHFSMFLSAVCNVYGSLADAQRTAVVRLDWYKYAHGLEHEYVLATVVRDNLDQKFYMRFDRRGTHPANVVEENVLKKETIESFSPEHQVHFAKDVSLERDVVNMFKERMARPKKNMPWGEMVFRRVILSDGVMRKDPGTAYLLVSYDLSSSKSLCLRDLSILVDSINKILDEKKDGEAPFSYRLMEESFWFARTCMGVVKKRYAPIENKASRAYTGGTYWVGKSASFWSRSETSRLTVVEDNPKQIEQLAQTLDQKIQENDDFLYLRREGLNEQRLTEILRRRQNKEERDRQKPGYSRQTEQDEQIEENPQETAEYYIQKAEEYRQQADAAKAEYDELLRLVQARMSLSDLSKAVESRPANDQET